MSQAKPCCMGRVAEKSRMRGDAHVRFRERPGVRFPRATRLPGCLPDLASWLDCGLRQYIRPLSETRRFRAMIGSARPGPHN